MDRKHQQQEIKRLIQLGSAARSGMTEGVANIQRQLDVPQRIRGSLQSHPVGWLCGSLVAGLVVSGLFRRGPARGMPPAQVKKRGLGLTLIGLTLTAVRPFAKVWLADQVKTYMARQLSRPARDGAPPKSPTPFS
jgi:hypothetical protein